MLVSRKELRTVIDDEYTITRILSKSRDLRVPTVNKKSSCSKGWTKYYEHFTLDDFLEAHKNHMSIMRKDYVEYNQKLHDIVIEAKRKLENTI